MASNQVFVSAGVYTSETDLTFVTRQVGVTTLGLVGETTKGPAFQPIFISNYDEFQTFFGGLDSTKFTGNNMPKYELPYIAKSYLSQSNQLFVTRILGLSGYDAGLSWGITLDAALDTSTTGATTTAITRTTLFYWTGDTGTTSVTAISAPSDPLLETIFEAGDFNTTYDILVNGATGTTSGTTGLIWNKNGATSFSGVSVSFTSEEKGTSGVYATGYTSGIITYYSGTSYSDVENMLVALIRSRGEYDANEVLNFECSATTDLAIGSTITTAEVNPLGEFELTGTSSVQGSFLYKVSFDNTKKNYISRVLGRGNSDGQTAVYLEEIYKTTLDNFISDNKVRGINLTLVNYSDSYDDYKEEYQPAVTPYFVSEVRGNKVLRLFRAWTISDGDSANSQIKVSITNIKPDDKEFDVVIRSYSDTDANVVALEKFSRCTMDPSSNNYVARKIGTLDGDYPSKSNYILLELAIDADTSDTFPAGFMGYPIRDYDQDGDITVTNPAIRYKQTYGTYENKRKYYLGVSDTVGIDNSFFTYIGIPDSSTIFEYTGRTDGFHMDSGATAVTIDGIDENPTFDVGNGEFRTDAGIINNDYSNIKARKFTCVPYGGFDAWDIFRDERTNKDTYAINGVKGQLAGPDGTGAFASYALTNGENGITSDYYAYLEGILTFNNPEAININVFATPGIDTFNHSNLIEETIEMIETDRADSLYIVTTPDVDSSGVILDEQDVVNDLESLYDSSYTATYWPWIQVNDAENNTYVWLPPTRDVVRNIALTDNVAFPWFAVAGVQRGDVNCIKARKKLTLEERDTLYEGRVNPIATFASEGVKIWGNKTLQVADTALNRINVRRLLLQARKLISAVSIRLLFEQNDDVVRSQFLNLVNPILDNIRAERGLTDFRVTVDNSAESKDRNELCGKIYLKPTRALEFICVDFVVTPTGASFDDI